MTKAWTLVAAALLGLSRLRADAQLAQPAGGHFERGTLPAHWLSQRPKCMEIPDWEVHEYNPDFYLLRQSPCTDYEKPFVFLLFGHERAILIDTGSRNGNLVPALTETVHHWLERNHRTSVPLVVVHTHSHEDHVFGDKEIAAIHDPAIPVTLIPAEVEATKRFYGITQWPQDIGHVDLGDRILDLIPIPGHDKVSVAFYDRQTAVLLAGDSLYPGRLYVVDFPAFQASTERLIAFTAGKPVAQILGNHIEQTSTPFLDYPIATMYQPQEHELQLSRGSLLELEDALLSMHGRPQRMALRDFSVWPVGAQFMSPEEDAAYKRHVAEQKRKMWDQSAP